METSEKNKKVQSKLWYQSLALIPFYLVFRLWQATIRVEVREDDRKILKSLDGSKLFLFWHNALFSAPLFQRRIRKGLPLYGLISASKDGAWLEVAFHLMGFKCVRGSANFRGAQSLKDMIRIVRQGNDLGITPDGSKGPAYVLKPGAAAVAKVCKCGLVLVGFESSSSWRLNSWDRFYIPKPFSVIAIRMEFIENYDALGAADPHEASLILQGKMMKLQGKDPLIPDPCKQS